MIDVVTTVTATAPSYDLTVLATVKDELAIAATDTTKDSWLSRGITQISKAIGNYCSRVFQIERLTDTVYLNRRWPLARRHQRLTGDEKIQLSRFPVQLIKSVTETALDDTQTVLIENTDFKVDYKTGQIIRLDSDTGFPTRWNVPEIAVDYAAGYGAVYAAEPHSVPNNPGPYTVTVTNASNFSVDLGVTGAANPYTVAQATGVYSFNSADAGKAVAITYATNAIPDDLVDAVLRLITQRWHDRARNPMLMETESAAVGGPMRQRFWVPTHDGAFPPEISGLLDGIYRVPTIG